MTGELRTHGRCPECGYIVHVRIRDGAMARHRIYGPQLREWGGYRLCPSEGKPPARYDPAFDAAHDSVYKGKGE